MEKEGKNKIEYKNIFIKYSANPDWPDNISHMDTRLTKLIKFRTKKFELNEYKKALEFLLECTSPITKVSEILWAFPRKEAFDILKALDGLKEEVPKLEYESIDEYDAYFDKEEVILIKL